MTDATTTTNEAPAAAAPAKAKTVYRDVTMDDGTVVQFPGKRQMVKSGFVKEDGSLVLRIDMDNGETRSYTLSPKMVPFYALHGAKQKFGDETDSKDPIEEQLSSLDALNERINVNNEWKEERESGDSFSGSSLVVKGMCDVTGKTKAEITAYLDAKLKEANEGNDANGKPKSMSRQKLYSLIRTSERFGPKIAELEAAAKAKKPAETVDLGGI